MNSILNDNDNMKASGDDIPEASFYNLEENENNDNLFYSDLDSDDPANHSEINGDPNNKKISAFRLLLEVMINPTEGWKKLKRSKISPDIMAAKCFYPLAGIASISTFSQLIYPTDASLIDVVKDALIIFISFFFGYFISIPINKFLLPSDIKDFPDSNFGKVFAMSAMSTLAIFYTLYRIIPMLEPVWVFLPLWTIFLVSKGSRFIKANQGKPIFVSAVISIVLIGSPILINRIFNIFIN